MPYRTAGIPAELPPPKPELKREFKEVWKSPTGTMKIVLVKEYWENAPEYKPGLHGLMYKNPYALSQMAYLYTTHQGPDGKVWIPAARLSDASGHSFMNDWKMYDGFGMEMDKNPQHAVNLLRRILKSFLESV